MIEETMSQLAHSQITQSMPSLADSIQGFQLIDNNEANNSVLGVLVALVGDTCVYIPVIYRNGKIYNMDIMYIPEMKQWLPTQDNWVTYIKTHKSDLLEVTETEEDQKNGGKTPGSVNLNLPFTQIIKAASAEEHMGKEYIRRHGMPYILKEAKAKMIEALSNPVTALNVPGLEEFIPKFASDGAAVLNTIAEFPAVGNAFAEFYSDKDLLAIANELYDNAKITTDKIEEAKAEDKGTVKVITMASNEAKDLTPENKVKLMRDGAVLVDNRGLKPSKVFKTKNNNKWGTCNDSGLYELLKLDGSSITAMVIPLTGGRALGFYDKIGCIVIPLDDFNKREVHIEDNKPLGQIYPFDSIEINVDGSLTDIKGRSNENDLSSETRGYIIFDKAGNYALLSYPHEVNWLSDEDDNAILKFSRSALCTLSGYRAEADINVNCIEEIPENGSIRLSGTTLYVPTGAKVLVVDGSKRNDLGLASVDNLEDAVENRCKMTRLKIFHNNNGITISDETGLLTSPLNKTAAAYELVKHYAVTPEDAYDMIKEASSKPVDQARFLIKMAAATAYEINIDEQPAEKHEEENVDMNQVLPEDQRKVLEIAGNSGIKDVMDVTVLKTLVSNRSSVRQVQEFIPRLFTAMDAAARLLFMVRAGSAMEEAYGETRATDLEDQLINLVDSIGDVIICLQQGRIDSVHNLLEGPLADSIG